MTHPLRCEYLSLGGMSVMCLDSYCPSRHTCDHVVKPSCWGASHSDAGKEREKVLDSVCNVDLTHFVWGDILSDEVRLCEGKSCNYCGRYNKELRQQGGE